MPVVTIDVGEKCTGGHYEIITIVDSVVVSREWRHESEILSGTSKTVKAASDALISTTTAPNMASWRNKVKSKSLTVPDGTPLNGIAAQQATPSKVVK